MTHDPAPHSTRGILKATIVALGIALVVLVTAILPAEYGIDPLGSGRALGLTALSGTTVDADEGSAGEGTTPASASASATVAGLAQDEFEVELRPFEGVEYRYRIEQGGSLVYEWTATADVGFEFHGEPDGAPDKYFDSYEKGRAARSQGSFTAEKPGVHGWFWENTSATRVTVTLRTAGFYSASTEYRDGERIERRFDSR